MQRPSITIISLTWVYSSTILRANETSNSFEKAGPFVLVKFNFHVHLVFRFRQSFGEKSSGSCEEELNTVIHYGEEEEPQKFSEKRPLILRPSPEIKSVDAGYGSTSVGNFTSSTSQTSMSKYNSGRQMAAFPTAIMADNGGCIWILIIAWCFGWA